MPQFDVQGPDGKHYMVNAPEGASQDDAIEYVATQHYGHTSSAPAPQGKMEVDYSKSSLHPGKNGQPSYYGPEQSGLMETLAGLGVGTQQVFRGAGNLVEHGLNAILPNRNDLTSQITNDHRAIRDDSSPFSDQAIKEAEGENRPVTDTGLGEAGTIAGNVVAGLPLSEAAGAASIAARGVPAVGRVLGSGLFRAGVEGAGNSAILSDPEDRGNAAIEGGAFGGLLHLGGSALSRTMRGLLQKSNATQDLEHLASQGGEEMFVPASLAGDDTGDITSRMTGSLYKNMLPLFPGVSGQLNRQGAAARGVVRDLALKESDPVGTIIQSGSGKDGTLAMQHLADAFDQEYKATVGSYAFNVPPDLEQTLTARVQQALPNVDKTTLEKAVGKVGGAVERFASGNPVVDGENLLNAKNAIYNSLQKMDDGPERDALKAAYGWFDSHIADEMNSGASKANMADLQKFQELDEPMTNFRQVGDAIQKAKAEGGRFTPAQLASAADPTGTIAHLGQTANQVLGKPAAQPSTEGRILAYLSGGYGAFHGLAPGALTLTAGANVLATKTAQRIVMGDTAAQQAVTKMLKAHPEMAARVQQILRLTGSAAIGNPDVNSN